MTDLETMKVMLKRAKIEFNEIVFGDSEPGIKTRGGEIWMIVEYGYPGFYTRIIFDVHGVLLRMEAYE
jgi:hypothetical protein